MEDINVLVVDDEMNIRNLIAAYLKKDGINGIKAANGMEALDIISKNKIHLIVLDIMMPVMDGFETLKEIRRNYNIPVIMLSARAEDEDKLLALGIGADNYETKPFSPKVLVAKIRALINRIYEDNKEEAESDVIDYNGLKISEKAHKVSIGQEVLNLSPTEFSLLLYLIKNKGVVLSREQILTYIWGYDFEGDIRVVDTTIKRLREKLKDKAPLIITVRGFGYKFDI